MAVRDAQLISGQLKSPKMTVSDRVANGAIQSRRVEK